MDICIFPGTFNPIHNGHIQMAEYTLHHYGFDKIIFIPSHLPPHKEVDKGLANHRLNMVKLATKYNPHFEVSDIEYKSDKTSYTIYTVQKLIQVYNVKGKINIIIGTDAFSKIDAWHKADELKTQVHFIVFQRTGGIKDISWNDYRQRGWDFEFAKMECVDISSTEIRENTKKSTDKNVMEYIDKNGLY